MQIEGVEVQLHSFLTTTLDNGEWITSCPGHFAPRKELWCPLKHKDSKKFNYCTLTPNCTYQRIQDMMDRVKIILKYEKTVDMFLLESTELTTLKQTYEYKRKLSPYCQEKEFTKGIFPSV
jgi:hypothetical protein